MKNITELIFEREHKLKCAQELLETAKNEDRVLTAAEATQSDELIQEATACTAKIDELKAFEARENAVSDAIKKVEGEKSNRISAPPQPTPQPKSAEDLGLPKVEFRYRSSSLAAFKGKDAEERAHECGQWLLATLFKNDKARRWCYQHGVGGREFAQGEGTNSAGGFLVPDAFDRAVIDLREQYGVFRRECSVKQMPTDNMVIPRRAGGLTATFTDENTALTESDKAWNQVTLSAKKLGVMTRISSELSEDAAINVADDIAQEAAYSFALKEDQCGFVGAGGATHGGITGVDIKIIDGSHTAGAVDAASANDSFITTDASDINTLMAALPAFARLNAKFYCSAACFSLVFERLAAAAGGNTLNSLSQAFVPRYLGHDIVLSEILPTSTAALNNVVMFLFGDLRLAATFGNRRGFRLRLSDERYFDQDQIAIKATERFDINVHDLGDNTNAGPIVAMIGNT